MYLGGQTCISNPNADQRGQMSINSGRQVIVPNSTFNCNGRITNIIVSMNTVSSGTDFSVFEVWHPTLPSGTYHKIGEVELPLGDRMGGQGQNNFDYAILSLNSSTQIEFQSGDVIGYYQPSDTQRLIWSIQTSGYISYSNNVISPSTSIDINNVDNVDTNHQPLIEISFGKVFCAQMQSHVITIQFCSYYLNQYIYHMYAVKLLSTCNP